MEGFMEGFQEVLMEGFQEAEQCAERSRDTVVVSGVPTDVLPNERMADKLIIHFQNRRRSDGGDVKCVRFPTNTNGVAFITFVDVEDAEKVVKKLHQIMTDDEFPEEYELTVFPFSEDVFFYVSNALLDLSMFDGDHEALLKSLSSRHRSLRFRPLHGQRTVLIEGPFTAAKALREELICKAARIQKYDSHHTAVEGGVCEDDANSEPREVNLTQTPLGPSGDTPTFKEGGGASSRADAFSDSNKEMLQRQVEGEESALTPPTAVTPQEGAELHSQRHGQEGAELHSRRVEGAELHNQRVEGVELHSQRVEGAELHSQRHGQEGAELHNQRHGQEVVELHNQRHGQEVVELHSQRHGQEGAELHSQRYGQKGAELHSQRHGQEGVELHSQKHGQEGAELHSQRYGQKGAELHSQRYGQEGAELHSQKNGQEGAELHSQRHGQEGAELHSQKHGQEGAELHSQRYGQEGAELHSQKHGQKGAELHSQKHGQEGAELHSQRYGQERAELHSQRYGQKGAELHSQKHGQEGAELHSQRYGQERAALHSQRYGQEGAELHSQKHGQKGAELHSKRYGQEGAELHSQRYGQEGAELHSQKHGQKGAELHSQRYGQEGVVLHSQRYGQEGAELHSQRVEGAELQVKEIQKGAKLHSHIPEEAEPPRQEALDVGDVIGPEEMWVDLMTFRYIDAFQKTALNECLGRVLMSHECFEEADLVQVSLSEAPPPDAHQASENLQQLFDAWQHRLTVHECHVEPQHHQKLSALCNSSASLYDDVFYTIKGSELKVIGPSTSSYMFYRRVSDQMDLY